MAFVFSFLGSIPPGTLNITILQLGLEKKLNIAWRFAIAAALMEYPYAWLAVKFEGLVTSSPVVLNNFKLLAALVMITLGLLNIWSAKRPSAIIRKFEESGFRRGLMLSVLNPLALPFWVAITAYLRMQGWINITSSFQLHSYLIGVSLGALALFMVVAYTAKWMIPFFQSTSRVKFIPGIVLLALGLYAFADYYF